MIAPQILGPAADDAQVGDEVYDHRLGVFVRVRNTFRAWDGQVIRLVGDVLNGRDAGKWFEGGAARVSRVFNC